MITWRERIETARNRTITEKKWQWSWTWPWFSKRAIIISNPHFTKEEIEMARNWMTCSIGEQLARGATFETAKHIDRVLNVYMPTPVDAQLIALGMSFYNAVANNRFGTALWILEAVENRALQLDEQQKSRSVPAEIPVTEASAIHE